MDLAPERTNTPAANKLINVHADNYLPGSRKDCVLFYHQDCEELAKKIAGQSPHVTLGGIQWG